MYRKCIVVFQGALTMFEAASRLSAVFEELCAFRMTTYPFACTTGGAGPKKAKKIILKPGAAGGAPGNGGDDPKQWLKHEHVADCGIYGVNVCQPLTCLALIERTFDFLVDAMCECACHRSRRRTKYAEVFY